MNKYLVESQNYFLHLETMPDTKVSEKVKDYYNLLNKTSVFALTASRL